MWCLPREGGWLNNTTQSSDMCFPSRADRTIRKRDAVIVQLLKKILRIERVLSDNIVLIWCRTSCCWQSSLPQQISFVADNCRFGKCWRVCSFMRHRYRKKLCSIVTPDFQGRFWLSRKCDECFYVFKAINFNLFEKDFRYFDGYVRIYILKCYF